MVKLIKKFLLGLIVIIILNPMLIKAAGGISVSKSAINIVNGNSDTFTITANNCAGRVDISSSNNLVASVSTTSIFLDNNSTTITVLGNGIGNSNIIIRLVDVATYDEEDISGKTYKINVNVNNPEPLTPTPTPQPKPQPKPVEPPKPTPTPTPQPIKPILPKSDNNNLSKLEVDGYKIAKNSDQDYELTVPKDVTSINVITEAEDAKSYIKGSGWHILEIGLNKIEIIVISESNKEKKYIINVTRKSDYTISDIDNILSDTTNNKIKISSLDTIISKDFLKKIKDAKKIIYLDYYNDSKDLLYSWKIDGSKLKDVKDFNPILKLENNNAEILKLSNYANGLLISLKEKNIVPSGISLKINISKYFNNNDLINIYTYNNSNNSFSKIINSIKLENNEIELNFENYENLFLTKANLNSKLINKQNVQKCDNKFEIISFVEFMIIILCIVSIIFLLIRNKKKKKNKIVNANYSYGNIDSLDNNSIIEINSNDIK